MKLKNFKNILPAAAIVLGSLSLTGCIGDLDVENINPQQTDTPNNDALFTKVYSNLVLTGQTGPNGNGDIDDIDEGTSSLIRQLWNANELPTDEAHCIWGDAGIPEFNHNAWGDVHPMMQALYYRLYFGITIANYFLQETEGTTDADVITQRAEVRFMRALYYSYLMDLYGNVPMITTVTKELAPQMARADLFKWIEGELKDVIGEGSGNEVMKDPAQKVAYGRADKAAAWLLLSRNYLNAEVYTGTPQWQLAKDYAQKVLTDGTYDLLTTGKGGYSAFQTLFMGDNDTNGAQKEIILPAIHDGLRTQTWGGCLFVIASVADEDMMKAYPYGSTEKWGGNRCRKEFVKKFFPAGGYNASGTPVQNTVAGKDDRALFFTNGHSLSITKESDFKKGFAYQKFSNLHADGSQCKHTQFVDTDFPMLRAAEAYLNIAEADARLNGGTCGTDGLNAIKAIRTRANCGTNPAPTTFTLDDICDEWSREFAYEGRRRMDLIRFGKFGGQANYKWEWMGGQENGMMFDKHLNIYPIPLSDLTANKNLKQNDGY
jgi:hypothetical protein